MISYQTNYKSPYYYDFFTLSHHDTLTKDSKHKIIVLDSLKAIYNLRLRNNTVNMIVWVSKVEQKQH